MLMMCMHDTSCSLISNYPSTLDCCYIFPRKLQHSRLSNRFPQTAMPVSVTLERVGHGDPLGYKFVVVVSFSLTSTTPRTSRMLCLVECASADAKRLYARTTSGVLRALEIRNWRRSRRVRQYKRRIRIVLRSCAVRGLDAVFADCSRALYRAAARERRDRDGSRRSAIRVATTRTSEDQELLDLASSLPPAQRARYLSLFA